MIHAGDSDQEVGTVTGSDFESRILAEAAAEAIDGKKGEEVVLLEVSRLIQITDWFVIATGTSHRHVQTLAEAVEERLDSFERKPIRIEGRQSSSWLLLDYGDFVVHLFLPETRAYYDLERLWGDAPRIERQVVSTEA